MAGFAVGTPGGLKPNDATALLRGLRQSAPPSNPNTPNVRKDPTADRLMALNQMRVSTEKFMTTINDDEASTKSFAIAIHAAMNKFLAGIEPELIMQGLLTTIGAAMAPASPMSPPGLGMPPGPGAPQGLSAGAQPGGTPPPGGMPVSPAPVAG